MKSTFIGTLSVAAAAESSSDSICLLISSSASTVDLCRRNRK
ncbi:MAG: hypothetical protein AAEJ47_03375 [Planctomycetota bacterium]